MPHAAMPADRVGEEPAAQKETLLRQADQMIYAELLSHASGLANAYELKWLALFCLAISVIVFAGPYVLSSYYVTLVCYYGAIIVFVVAGWGAVRSGVTARCGESIYRYVAMLYLAYFLFFFVMFGVMMLSPTLDKRWVLNLPQTTLRRK